MTFRTDNEIEIYIWRELLMISNQYQNQPNFRGHLLKAGIRLPEEKFEKVAELYSARTLGKPDLTIADQVANGDQGRLFHSTYLLRGDKEIATMSTKSFKRMFDSSSPKEITDELVNISRKTDPEDKASVLKREINSAHRRLLNVIFNLEKAQTAQAKKDYSIIKTLMEQSIAKKEKQYDRIKPGEISGEWCI